MPQLVSRKDIQRIYEGALNFFSFQLITNNY